MLAWVGRFNWGLGSPKAAPGQSDLAVFLQLDALPNANHSESVVGDFICHRHRCQTRLADGHDRMVFVTCHQHGGQSMRYWLRPRSDGFLVCHRHWYHKDTNSIDVHLF
ncbi:Hypothetical predicted protein [Octopus vulgaris]|uniref:Uncharacterized protein n=1 Tax=Octopus vulgaris TaxID=6645 RepID=A0AA36FLY0_OCTVU|nr:Hypothetical predicted protein [Octopus vulgaris]